jgi:hypothetical protein
MDHPKLATLIREELDKRGVKNLQQAARTLGVSAEAARHVLQLDHVPKDSTLARIAGALGLEPAVLILAGHRQRLPEALHTELLTVASAAGGDWGRKRKWPLSQEQCDYLGVLLQPGEIQLIRRCRQLTPDERIKLAGFVEYRFATSRVSPGERTVPAEQAEEYTGAEQAAVGE